MKRGDHLGGAVPRARDSGRSRGHRVAPVTQALPWAAARWSLLHPEAAGLSRVVWPGAVCLDIGTDCGVCTGVLSVLAGSGGQVHCVGSRDRSARWAAIASLFGGAEVVVHRHPERVHTVDALCRQENLLKIDLIRAHVPVAELGFLLGAFSTLLRERPVLLLQLGERSPDSERTSTDVVRSLTRTLAYAMYCWQDGDWRPTAHVMKGVDRYLFSPRPIPAR